MQDRRICANCGTPAQAGEQFCGECGAALPPIASQPTVTSQPIINPPPAFNQPPYQGQPYQSQPTYQTGGPIAPPPVYNAPPPVYNAPLAPAKRSNPMPLIIGAVVVLLLVGVVVTVLLLTGNKSNNTTNNTTNNPTNNTGGNGGNTALATATTASGGSNNGNGGSTTTNADLLKQAAANMQGAKSYHLDVSGSSTGTALTMVGDIDVANNKSSLSISSAGQNVEVISVGSNSFVSTDSGATFTNAGSSGAGITSGLSQFTSMWSSLDSASIDQAKDKLADGSPAIDTIDGSSCKHISTGINDLSGLSAGSGSSSGTIDLWVATDGSRVCQMKVTTTDKTTDLTLKWSNLNATFNIQTPPSSN